MAEVNAASKINVERFDAIAATWDENPRRIALARAVAGAILDQIALTGTERAMEFGCGTGLVTALLAPNLGYVLAADSSQGMLDVLRGKLEGHGIRNVETLQADLSDVVPAGPFDFVCSSMTLHHIEDVAGLISRIHDRLAPGGRIAFADLAREDGSFHDADTAGIMHHGFEPAELTAWLQAAGFIDIAVSTIYQVRKVRPDGSEREYPVLLVTARRSG
jgi:SAM-dependent methyltransferase